VDKQVTKNRIVLLIIYDLALRRSWNRSGHRADISPPDSRSECRVSAMDHHWLALRR